MGESLILNRMRIHYQYSVPTQRRILFENDLSSSALPHIGEQQLEHGLGVTARVIDCFRSNPAVQVLNPDDPVDRALLPPLYHIPFFYTRHYREQHIPYIIRQRGVENTISLPADQLAEFAALTGVELARLVIHWEFVLPQQSAGLIVISLEVDDPLLAVQAQFIIGLHLLPTARLIPLPPALRRPSYPEFVTLDELVQAIHHSFFAAGGFLNANGDQPYRFRPLDYEMLIPFVYAETDSRTLNQQDFIAHYRADLAALLFKSACWGVQTPSPAQLDTVLSEDHRWSIADHAFVLLSYQSAVMIHLYDHNPPGLVAGRAITTEEAVFHSFRLVVANYYLLRILDELLDHRLKELQNEVEAYNNDLHQVRAYLNRSDSRPLRQLDKLVIQITDLQYSFTDLFEEMDNADKLIDYEWHIILLEKINAVLGTRTWRSSISGRVENFERWVHLLEDEFDRFLELNEHIQDRHLSERVTVLSIAFGLLSFAELMGLLLAIGFDDENSFFAWFRDLTGMSDSGAHVAAVTLIILLTLLLGSLIPFGMLYAYRGLKALRRPR
jgi:hypothetical protein